MFSLEQFYLPLLDHKHFCIAYSGGLDSHVLLYAMVQCRLLHPDIHLRAVHIHHGLSDHADHWQGHCRSVCADLNIEFITENVTVTINPGDSVEAEARDARYATFARMLQPGENLLTAHTQNDQAETLLLQLLRGAGVKGLSAMPVKKALGAGFLYRPLLNVCRDELENYAKEKALKWIEDDSNVDTRFNRNYLRREVFPILLKRWPQAFATISRSAKNCVEAAALLDELADIDLQATQSALPIAPLLKLSSARQRNALRRWIAKQGFILPNSKHLSQIQQDVLLAAPDAHPIFRWANVEMRRQKGELILTQSQPQG